LSISLFKSSFFSKSRQKQPQKAKTCVLYSIFGKMREGNFCFLFDLSFVGARAARLHWFLENLLKNQ